MCQEEQFQQSALPVMVITYGRQERMQIFPSRHKWQCLAPATRQRDGHNAEVVYCRPKIVSGARTAVNTRAVLERANPLQSGRRPSRSLLAKDRQSFTAYEDGQG